MDKLIDIWEAIAEPRRWPRWLRRTFLLTSPVTGPIYAVVLIVWILIMILAALGTMLVLGVAHFWSAR